MPRTPRLLPSLTCLFLTACLSQDAQLDTTYLVGAQPTDDYPAFGYLRVDGRPHPHCGATLIAPDLAVTAAHCVDHLVGDSPGLSLAFGAFAPDKDNVEVASVHVHPNFSDHWCPVFPDCFTDFAQYDVAVLRLASTILDRRPAVIAAATVDQG
jgi:hypothetical protein